MADAKRQSSLGADFSRRSPFTRRCACCVDHLRFDASFRPALVGVPTRMAALGSHLLHCQHWVAIVCQPGGVLRCGVAII
jgi:hypothetical protein